MPDSADTPPYRPLREQIAEKMREGILLGDFPPGSSLPERETSAELGVSRTPFREAMGILSKEGLVTIRPARSPIVANPTVHELTDLLTVQAALEALAGELACETGSREDFEQVAGHHETMLMISDTAPALEFFKADMAFHSAVVAATGNAALMEIHAQNNARLWRVRFLTSSTRYDRDRVLQQHGRIAQTLQNRDKVGASSTLREHLKDAVEKISRIYAKQDGSADHSGATRLNNHNEEEI